MESFAMVKGISEGSTNFGGENRRSAGTAQGKYAP
jgi:hypothetical protein